MKIIFLLLLLPFLGYSQSNMLITLEGQTDVLNGLIHTENFYPTSSNYSNEILMVHFVVSNQSGVDQQCTITQKRIDRPANWSESIVWNMHFIPNSDLYETPNTLGNPTFTIINGSDMTTDGNQAILGVILIMSESPTNHALYRYYITNAQTNEYIDSVDLEINAVLGMEELTEHNIIISPNPSQGKFHLNLDNTTIETIKIYNQEGKRIAQPIIDSLSTIDLNYLDEGLYLALIFLKDGSVIRKQLIIQG